MRTFGRRIIVQGLMVVGAMLALSAGAQAQRWENAFGSATTEEAAHNGVRPVTEGGYVAVGRLNNPGTGQQDIYVVRTNNQGGLAWSKTYDIGVVDVATDIEEVPNATGLTDGFIITGYTNHLTGATCGGSYDIFLLRIDRCGNVIWQNTYGMRTVDEYAWDVVRATVGDGVTTSAGDYVVAGWQGNTSTRDGYLLRVNSAGAIIWGTLYRGPQNRDDYFFALDEATTTGSGEIIAAGGTTSYRAIANLDAWEVRVNGNTGAVIAATAFGGATTSEDLRSVQELNTGTFQGQIVAVGRTASGTTTDIYVLQSDATLFPVADQLLGFCDWDEGYYVREIPAAAACLPSTIIVTGYIIPLPGWGHGNQDAFLQEFRTGDLALVGAMAVYGDINDDRGWSVEPVQESLPCRRGGFIVAGFVEPVVTPPDAQQLYMFKTDVAKSTGCELSFTPPTLSPPFDYIHQNPTTATLRQICTPPITCLIRTWIQTICPLITDGTVLCSIPSCQLTNCPVPDENQEPDSQPDISREREHARDEVTYAKGGPVREE